MSGSPSAGAPEVVMLGAESPPVVPPDGSIEPAGGRVLDSRTQSVSRGDESERMASFGEELRRQRELRGIGLREISDSTKINIRFLEALEKNEFTHLPGGQFNKGFIRAYARHIGVDAEELVDSYLMELRRHEEGDKSHGRTAAPRGARSSGALRGLVAGVLAVLAMLALAAAVWWFLRMRAERQHPGETGSEHGAPPAGAGAGRSSPTPGTGAPQGAAAGGPAARPEVEPSAAAESSPSASREGTRVAGSEGSPLRAQAPAEVSASAAGMPQGSAGLAAAVPVSPIQGPGLSAPAPLPGTRETHEPLPGAAPLVMRVVPLKEVRFDVLCDGRPAHSGLLEAARVVKFECPGVLEISLGDAGAVNLTVNGERIYLGRPGQSVSGRHVSAANYLDYATPPPGAISP